MDRQWLQLFKLLTSMEMLLLRHLILRLWWWRFNSLINKNHKLKNNTQLKSNKTLMLHLLQLNKNKHHQLKLKLKSKFKPHLQPKLPLKLNNQKKPLQLNLNLKFKMKNQKKPLKYRIHCLNNKQHLLNKCKTIKSKCLNISNKWWWHSSNNNNKWTLINQWLKAKCKASKCSSVTLNNCTNNNWCKCRQCNNTSNKCKWLQWLNNNRCNNNKTKIKYKSNLNNLKLLTISLFRNNLMLILVHFQRRFLH